MVKSRFLKGIIFLIIAIFLIILGIIFMITFIFWFIGIPLLIIGIIFLLISIFAIAFGTISDLLSLIKKPFRRKPHIEKENVIELEKRRGVYRAK